MQAPEVGENGGRQRFPALDPEPPARPWPRRLLLPAVALAVAGAVAAAISFGLSGGGDRPGTSAARRGPALGRVIAGGGGPEAVKAGGRILAETSGGGLVLAPPEGGHQVKLSKLGEFPPSPPLAASLDARYLAAPSGEVISLATPGHPSVSHTGLTIVGRVLPAPPDPFADHDRYLVLEDDNYGDLSSSVTVRLGSLATGQVTTLGLGDWVAGDPRAAGALVSVAAPGSQAGPAVHRLPDARLELRDAGAKPVVLAAASTLNKVLGEAAGLPVDLVPYPSPDGRQVAVVVMPLTAHPVSGIVVLSRAGKVVDSVLPSLGTLSNVAWSPSGTSLAFVTSGSLGPSLSVWTPGGQSQTAEFPVDGIAYRTCLWSPNGAALVCSDPSGRHWAVAPSSGNAIMVTEPGRGTPVAWLP